jgi:hypothetical protein
MPNFGSITRRTSNETATPNAIIVKLKMVASIPRHAAIGRLVIKPKGMRVKRPSNQDILADILH